MTPASHPASHPSCWFPHYALHLPHTPYAYAPSLRAGRERSGRRAMSQSSREAVGVLSLSLRAIAPCKGENMDTGGRQRTHKIRELDGGP